MAENISFGRNANDDHDKGNYQAEGYEYFKERALVVFSGSKASHGEKHDDR